MPTNSSAKLRVWEHDLGYQPGQNAPGFSLLELMVIVTLIMILATFAQPYYRTAVVRARESVLRDELFTLRAQIDRFTLDEKRAPASLEELVEKGYMGGIPRDPFTGLTEIWTVEQEDVSLDTAPTGQGPGIVDVHSGSNETSLEGTPYSSW